MNPSHYLAIATAVYGTAFALAPLAQLRRIAVAGDSNQISLVYFGGLALNLALWLCYGLSTGDVVLIVSNSAGVTTAVATVVVVFRYRRPTERTPDAPTQDPQPVALAASEALPDGGS